MSRRSKTPIESFGPEVFNALVEGSRRTITLDLRYRDAVRLRLRMHRLRNQMREESHQLHGLVMKAELRIEITHNTVVKTSSRGVKYPANPDDKVKLIIAPRDSDFVDVLNKAGVKVQNVTQSDLDATKSTTTTTSLEDLLKDLK